VDQWFTNWNPAAGAAATITRSTSSTLPNAVDDLHIAVTGAATFGSGNFFVLKGRIEGSWLSSLGWGTPNAQPATLSFPQSCSVPGVYTVWLDGSTSGLSYQMPYYLASNTQAQESFLIPGDTSGSWGFSGTGAGLEVVFSFDWGVPAAITPFTWASGSGTGALGGVHMMATSGATCDLGLVRLEPGSAAHAYTPRSPAQRLAIAQRYYGKGYDQGVAPGAVAANAQADAVMSGTTGVLHVTFPGICRADPAVTPYSPNSGAINMVYDVTGLADVAATAANVGMGGATISFTSVAGHEYRVVTTDDCHL
ncbi:MAG TPA: hypothetical protein VGR91_19135, partial [Stellaceae bacterium]|nr:hypothetical protein [Stellaceae bacterium]